MTIAMNDGAAPQEWNVSVGKAIRKERLVQSLTQARLACLANLSPNYIARLERGELGPSLRVAQKLCRALGVKVDSILKEAS